MLISELTYTVLFIYQITYHLLTNMHSYDIMDWEKFVKKIFNEESNFKN
ncbi:hypothetical protein ABIB50_002743 [Mucilaginibacter sp. UYCu711]